MMNEFADALIVLIVMLGSLGGFIIWLGLRDGGLASLKARKAERKRPTYTKIPQRKHSVGR